MKVFYYYNYYYSNIVLLHNKRLSAKYKFAKAIQNKSNFKLYFRKITMKSSARTQKDSTLQRSDHIIFATEMTKD